MQLQGCQGKLPDFQESYQCNRRLQLILLLLLCRCTQVHGCLGKLPEFQESYQRNRRLQLNSDLAPPAHFLEGYQDFIAQLTGFFIIEDRVQRRCADLCAGAQVLPHVMILSLFYHTCHMC